MLPGFTLASHCPTQLTALLCGQCASGNPSVRVVGRTSRSAAFPRRRRFAAPVRGSAARQRRVSQAAPVRGAGSRLRCTAPLRGARAAPWPSLSQNFQRFAIILNRCSPLFCDRCWAMCGSSRNRSLHCCLYVFVAERGTYVGYVYARGMQQSSGAAAATKECAARGERTGVGQHSSAATTCSRAPSYRPRRSSCTFARST